MRKRQSDQVVDIAAKTIADAHHFSHEAMATVYELYIVDEDEDYARAGAQAAFAEVDRLELEMSRFLSNSDISRLNAAEHGEIVDLGMDTFECLRRAKEMHDKTGGAFDISVGALYACWLDEDRRLRVPSAISTRGFVRPASSRESYREADRVTVTTVACITTSFLRLW